MANNKPQSRSSRSPSAELSDDYDLKTNINPAHSYRALKSSIQKQYERHQGVQFAARHAIEMNEIKEAQKREDALIAAEKNRIRELKRLELKRAKHAKYIQQRAELEAKQEADIAAEQARIESEKARQAAQAAEVAAQQAQAAAERQRQEQAAAAAAAAARAAPPPPQPSTASTSGASLNNGGVPAANHDYHIGARHIMPANLQKSKIGLQQASAGDGSLPHSQELLTIHGRLKQIRVIVKKELNSDKEYKAFIGNARRKIVSAVGKLVPDARQNQPIVSPSPPQLHLPLTIFF